MKLEKLKRWIAAFTTISMIMVFIPQTAFASVVLGEPIANPAGGLYRSNQNVSITVDENSKCTTYTIDGGTPDETSTQYTGIPITINGNDGALVELRAKSFSNNDCTGTDSSTMYEEYKFDKTAPVVAITSPSDGSLATGLLDVKGSVTDTNPSSYAVVILDGANNIVDSTGNIPQAASFIDQPLPTSWNASYAEEGDYTVRLTATDAAGNISSAQIIVVVDRTAPNTPTMIAPVNDSYTTSKNGSTRFEWMDQGTTKDPISYQAEFSDKPNVDNSGSFESLLNITDWLSINIYDYPNLEEGIYYWHVKNKDQFGNESNWADPWRVTIDNSAPVINKIYKTDNVDQNDIVDSLVAITQPTSFSADAMDFWQGSENIGGIGNYEWTSSDPENVEFETPNSSETKITTVKDGTYTIILTTYDKAGNSDSAEFMLTSDTTDLGPTDLPQVLTPVSLETVITNNLPTGGPEEGATFNGPTQDVKAAATDENKDNKKSEDENSNQLPYFGIGLLILLALVGLYLLYQQYPDKFAWLMFWKK